MNYVYQTCAGQTYARKLKTTGVSHRKQYDGLYQRLERGIVEHNECHGKPVYQMGDYVLFQSMQAPGGGFPWIVVRSDQRSTSSFRDECDYVLDSMDAIVSGGRLHGADGCPDSPDGAACVGQWRYCGTTTSWWNECEEKPSITVTAAKPP